MSLPALKDLLGDEKLYCVSAIVAIHDGETSHWRVSDEGAVIVDVVSTQHSVPISTIMKGGGVWRIPPIGAEVVVNFDHGEFEGDAYLIAVCDHAPIGVAEETILIVEANVKIRATNATIEAMNALIQADEIRLKSEGGATKKLAFVEDVNDLRAKYLAHYHAETSTTTSPPLDPANPPSFASIILPWDGTQITESE